MAYRTKIFQQVPWDGGLVTDRDESTIGPNNLTIADNVIFDTRSSRKIRDSVNHDWDDQSDASQSIIAGYDFWYGTTDTKTQKTVALSDNKTFYSYNSSGVRTALTNDSSQFTAWSSSITNASQTVLNNLLITAVDGSGNVMKKWDGSGNIKDLGNQKQVFTITTVADSSDSLDQKYFIIYDAANTSVGVILNTPAGTAAASTGADRDITVTIATNDTANTVASAIQSQLDADAQFVATVSTNIVTITQASAGYRPEPDAANSGFTLAVTTKGYDAPPVASAVQTHLGRLWCNDKTNIDRLHFSNTGNPELFNGYEDSGAIDIGIGDSDPSGITAIFPTFRGDLYVAKRTKLYRIVGTSPETMQILKVTDNIGCVGPNAFAATEDDIIFVSERGVHSLTTTAAYGDVESSFVSADIQRTFNTKWLKSRLKYVRVANNNELNCIAFGVTDTDKEDTSINNRPYFYNYEKKKWFTWSGNSFTDVGGNSITILPCQAIWTQLDSDKRRFYFGTHKNRITKCQTGEFQDTAPAGTDSPILYRVKTARIWVDGSPFSVKGFKRFFLLYQPIGTHTITATIKIDNFPTQSVAFTQVGDSDLLGSTFVLGSSEWGAQGLLQAYGFAIDGFGRGVTIELTQSNNNTDIEPIGFAIEWESADLAQEGIS